MKRTRKRHRRPRRSRRKKRPGGAMPAIVLATVVVAAGLIWLGTRWANRASETVTLPARIARPSADGTALGSPDAPVLVEEFSDFQ